MLDIFEKYKDVLKIREYKEQQKFIIENILNGKNVIGILPTGFGKSLIFQFLSLALDGITLVISPLIALMEDQSIGLEKKGISHVVFNSNISKKQQTKAYNVLINGSVKLVYTSPEKLLNKEFRELFRQLDVSLVVIDEAHTILWKDSFRSAFAEISVFINLLKNKPSILALTATATTKTIDIIKKTLKMEEFVLVKESILKKNIYYQVLSVKNKNLYLKKYFSKYCNDKILVYSLTRRTVEYLGEVFKDSLIYHGGLDENTKKNNQELFTLGKKKIMFCTNAFGMGIDISDIYHVIHYEIPVSLEDLVQQAGRAARDGSKAIETILFDFEDIKLAEYFINQLDKKNKRIQMLKLEKVVDFCLSRRCRQKILAQYFNEKKESCCNCDNCNKKTLF